MTESRPELVLDEAKRLLARQEAGLDHLRARAGAMMSVAAIAAGLFGSHTLSADQTPAWRSAFEIAALVFFGVIVALTVYIGWPRRFVFSHDLSEWIAEMKDGRVTDALDFSYNVSRDLNSYRQANVEKIQKLWKSYSWICALLGAQVLAWAVAAL